MSKMRKSDKISVVQLQMLLIWWSHRQNVPKITANEEADHLVELIILIHTALDPVFQKSLLSIMEKLFPVPFSERISTDACTNGSGD